MRYSQKQKEAILKYADGHTLKETSEKFNVSIAAISKWRVGKAAEDNGSDKAMRAENEMLKSQNKWLKQKLSFYEELIEKVIFGATPKQAKRVKEEAKLNELGPLTRL